MHLPLLLNIVNQPWLIDEQALPYWQQVAEQVLFHNMAFPAHPNANKYYGYRVDSNGTLTPDGSTYVLDMRGPLMKNDYCGSPGMESMAMAIEAATADPTVHSIIARIDSPGGTVAGTHNLARMISSSPKCTVAYANGSMTSAAYWVGSSFREVIADDAHAGALATIGSIGTVATIVDDRESLSSKGLKVRHVYATKSKRKGKAYEEVMDGKLDRVQKTVDALNDTFLQAVQTNRAGKLRLDLEDVLEGDTYNAKDALRFGLIDKIGTFRYAVKRSLYLAKTISKTTQK